MPHQNLINEAEILPFTILTIVVAFFIIVILLLTNRNYHLFKKRTNELMSRIEGLENLMKDEFKTLINTLQK